MHPDRGRVPVSDLGTEILLQEALGAPQGVAVDKGCQAASPPQPVQGRALQAVRPSGHARHPAGINRLIVILVLGVLREYVTKVTLRMFRPRS